MSTPDTSDAGGRGIVLRQLTKQFTIRRNTVTALDRVDLDTSTGAFVALPALFAALRVRRRWPWSARCRPSGWRPARGSAT